MRKNESKDPLVLMEQVIMVLVFALAAALCIQAFALARTNSLRITERDHAMNISQTLAETVKAYAGDQKEVCKELGGRIEGKQLVFYYDSDWKEIGEPEDAAYQAVFAEEKSERFCRYGKITVSDTEHDREVFSIRVAWQGEDANE